MIAPKILLTLLTIFSVLMSANIAHAQTYKPSNRIPVTDNTLGTKVLGNNGNFTIEGGLNRGQNLFHSFTDFSVPTGGGATFINPVGNQSIITRVTGNLFSDINGLVNTQGANFLLINPSGVVFGPNTQLNVGKVFAASTANGLDLVDGSGRTITFGTNPNGDAPLLSVNPNVFFNVAQLNIGSGNGQISNFGTLKTTNPNQYIGLIGGNVTMNGGKISTLGGRVELGGLSAPGSVRLGADGNIPKLNFSPNGARADVSLTNQAVVDTRGFGSGDIVVTARNLELLAESSLRAGILEGFGTPATVAGDIRLNATGKIVVGSNSVIANYVASDAIGRGGDITIDTSSLILQDGANIISSTFGQGNAGNLKITAKDAVFLSGETNIFNGVFSGANGRGGDITIDTGDLILQDGAKIFSSTFSQGNAGNLKVTAKDAVFLSGKSSIANSVQAGGVGNSSNIDLSAASLSLRDGSQIITVTEGTAATQPAGQGDAGNIMVKVTGAIDIAGTKDGTQSGITSIMGLGSKGNAGNITLEASSLSLQDGAALLSSTLGQGNVGNINAKVAGAINIAGAKDGISSGIFSFLYPGAKGNAGNITIDSGSFSLLDGGVIVASTFSQGNAGNITIIAKDAVSLAAAGPSVFSTVESGGVGKSGNIDIKAGSLSIRNGTQVQTLIRTASTTQPAGRGDAGNINVKVTGAVEIVGPKGSSTSGLGSNVQLGAEGKGGNITIDAGSISFREGAGILASTAGKGDAGNVTVTAKDGINFQGTAGILSQVERGGVGKGGNITVDANSISFRDGAGIKSDTLGEGNAGTIKINARDAINISGESNFSRSVFVERGGLFVGSQSKTGVAGDIIVTSPNITLDNDGTINAESRSGNGGNINIGSQSAANLLLLRRGGNISTNAEGTALQGGNGGNININSNLIVALPNENSDISANAVKGRGGNVNINSQGLFGIQFSNQKTNNSDITASSDFGLNGSVIISTPGTDPGRDKGELTAAPNDASNQISQACSASQQDNKLYITGRGGHPANATDPLTSDVVWRDPRAVKPQPVASNVKPTRKLAPPAVGWVFDGKGKVTLISAQTEEAPTGTKVVCPKVETR
jgi:filamentous hemagglutinin family protein